MTRQVSMTNQRAFTRFALSLFDIFFDEFFGITFDFFAFSFPCHIVASSVSTLHFRVFNTVIFPRTEYPFRFKR